MLSCTLILALLPSGGSLGGVPISKTPMQRSKPSGTGESSLYVAVSVNAEFLRAAQNALHHALLNSPMARQLVQSVYSAFPALQSCINRHHACQHYFESRRMLQNHSTTALHSAVYVVQQWSA